MSNKNHEGASMAEYLTAEQQEILLGKQSNDENVVAKEKEQSQDELKDYLLKGLMEAGFAGEKKKIKAVREWAVKMVLGFEKVAKEKATQEHRLEQVVLLGQLARERKGRITERLQEVSRRYGETFDPTQDRFTVVLDEGKEKEVLKTLSPEDVQKIDEIKKKVQVMGFVFEEISRLRPPDNRTYAALSKVLHPTLKKKAGIMGKVVPYAIGQRPEFEALSQTEQHRLQTRRELPPRLVSEMVEAGFNRNDFQWRVRQRKKGEDVYETNILGDETLNNLSMVSNAVNERVKASIVTPDALLVDRSVITEIVECKAVEPWIIEEFIRQLEKKPKVQKSLSMTVSETRVNELRREARLEAFEYPFRLDFKVPVAQERRFLDYALEIKQRENLKTEFVIPKGKIPFRLRVPADISPVLAKELESELAKHGHTAVTVEPLPCFTSAEIDCLTEAFYQEAKGEL